MAKRIIIIVLDAVGIGEMPDAADYGDVGANTLGHVAKAVGGLDLPNLRRLGLGNIAPILGVPPVESPAACWGKMAEKSKGKDTTTGHWELAGIITNTPFPTYPNGFPSELIAEFESRIGRKILGNKPASGTQIIEELGPEHIRTGFPIVYTSADSVFQIACHEDVVPVEELYRMCRMARQMLVAPHNVSRVIARPFIGHPGAFVRTEHRRDFSIEPPADTLLDVVARSGTEVVAIGKIEDIFAGRGITRSMHTTNNRDGIEAIIEVVRSGAGTLVVANLVDFDMLYGHRNDPVGFARALEEFDRALSRILCALKPEDVLFITADHGCDPTTPCTDHTREYVPILVFPPEALHRGSSPDLGTRATFSDLACTVADLLGIPYSFSGHTMVTASI